MDKIPDDNLLIFFLHFRYESFNTSIPMNNSITATLFSQSISQFSQSRIIIIEHLLCNCNSITATLFSQSISQFSQSRIIIIEHLLCNCLSFSQSIALLFLLPSLSDSKERDEKREGGGFNIRTIIIRRHIASTMGLLLFSQSLSSPFSL